MYKINIQDDIDFSEKNKVVKKIRDTKNVLIAIAKLLPNQEIPKHLTNARVSIFVNNGKINFIHNGEETLLGKNDFITIEKNEEMCIKNLSEKPSSFIITKAPNPGPAR